MYGKNIDSKNLFIKKKSKIIHSKNSLIQKKSKIIHSKNLFIQKIQNYSFKENIHSSEKWIIAQGYWKVKSKHFAIACCGNG